MMKTTRSILGRLSSFSLGRGRLLASLLIETVHVVIVSVNMITDMIIITGGNVFNLFMSSNVSRLLDEV